MISNMQKKIINIIVKDNIAAHIKSVCLLMQYLSFKYKSKNTDAFDDLLAASIFFPLTLDQTKTALFDIFLIQRQIDKANADT